MKAFVIINRKGILKHYKAHAMTMGEAVEKAL